MLLIGHGQVITGDESQAHISDGCVVIQDQWVLETGSTVKMKSKYPGAIFLDVGGKVIMPGLINAHMHLYSTFARGMALKNSPPGNFREILERLWWRLDKALTEEDIYYSALVPLVDCIRNGTTTIFDHHSSPGAVRGSLFTILKAARVAGIRSCLCYEVSDRDGKEITDQGIRENLEFIHACKEAGDEMAQGMFGLHASLTLSDETLSRCCRENREIGTGFHIHAAEGRVDAEECLRRHGRRVIERLFDFGVLGPKTIAAHCVHVDDREVDLLKESKTKVVHNPESNMGNAVGCAPVIDMLKRGVYVGLGTDGYTCDMLESLKVANILHKHQLGDPKVGWAEAPDMLFRKNSMICEEYFSRPLGRLVPGAFADVIVVNYDPPTPMGARNLYGHILFGMSGPLVDTTVINGRVVMHGRKLVGVDEGEIVAKSRELAEKVWQRF